MSAKGGVGKSVISSLIALSLPKATLIDLDVHAMAIPKLFGLEGRLHEVTSKGIEPFRVKNVAIVSLSGIVKDRFVVLPGNNVAPTMESLIAFSDIDTDYVVFDLPPGLGDEVLVLERVTDFVPVVVTTPSRVSRKVVDHLLKYLEERGKRAKVLVNMAYMECDGKTVKPFGDYEGFGLPLDPDLENYVGRIQDYEGPVRAKVAEFISASDLV